MILAGSRYVSDLLPEIATVKLGAALSGRADVGNGETRIVGHGDERGFSIAGMAFNANLFGVDGVVGFKIVEGAAGAPSPGTKGAPVIALSRLAFVAGTAEAVG